MKNKIQLFDKQKICSIWDEENEKWQFSIADIVGVLSESIDQQAYWRKLKQRLKEEGNETVKNCHGLKMLAPDGKMRFTDVADTEQILRLVMFQNRKNTKNHKIINARKSRKQEKQRKP